MVQDLTKNTLKVRSKIRGFNTFGDSFNFKIVKVDANYAYGPNKKLVFNLEVTNNKPTLVGSADHFYEMISF